jgi:hypothetical protein
MEGDKNVLLSKLLNKKLPLANLQIANFKIAIIARLLLEQNYKVCNIATVYIKKLLLSKNCNFKYNCCYCNKNATLSGLVV